MNIVRMNVPDYYDILANLASYWGADDIERLERVRILHHPMMIHEFGDCAFVIKENDGPIAYLMGLISTSVQPVAYVHMIAVHQGHQRRGYGQKLYAFFEEFAKSRGCLYLKAITSPNNDASIQFHRNIGMQMIGETEGNGAMVVKSYAGVGEDRVVFLKKLYPAVTHRSVIHG